MNKQNILAFGLVVIVCLGLGHSGRAHAYWTMERHLVNQCPDDRRYLVSAFTVGGAATYGACDDCGSATEVGRTTTSSGVTIEYECDDPSPNEPCEERMSFGTPVLTSEEEASGEWETFCVWASPVPGLEAHTFWFRDCDPGFVQEVWDCSGIPFDSFLEPGCRCLAEADSEGDGSGSTSCSTAGPQGVGGALLFALLLAATRRTRRQA